MRPPPIGQHRLQRPATRPEGRVEVPLHRQVECLVRQLDEGSQIAGTAGVVHQYIDAAESLDSGVHKPFDIALHRRVAGNIYASLRGIEFSECPLRLCLVASHERNRCAVVEKGPRDPQPNPAVPPVMAATFPSNRMFFLIPVSIHAGSIPTGGRSVQRRPAGGRTA